MALKVVFAAVLVILVGIELGYVPVPLRSPPAHPGQFMAPRAPPDELPPLWDADFKTNNAALRRARRFFAGHGIQGVETVAAAPNGTVALVSADGRVFFANPDGGGSGSGKGGGYAPPRHVATIAPGRCLGAAFSPRDGSLIVANAPLGLVQLAAGDSQGAALLKLTALAARAAESGEWLSFADGVDIAADGTIYFTHASDVEPFPTPDGTWDAMESAYVSLGAAAPSGRLARYDPRTGQAEVLARGLWFANGAALSAEEDFLVVADSLQARLLRHWLKGPQAGRTEPFAGNLPGAPDGVARAADGGFWVAIITDFPPLMRLSSSRLVRALLSWAPPALRPPRPPRGLVLKLSSDGAREFALADPTGATVHHITSAVESPDGLLLWLGDLHGDGAHALNLPRAVRAEANRGCGGGDAKAAAALLEAIKARHGGGGGDAEEEGDDNGGDGAEADNDDAGGSCPHAAKS